MKMNPIFLPLFLLAIAFLAAWNPEQEPELAPTATVAAISQATDIPTATPLLPTATIAATNTPTPLPTVTAIPLPTATPPPFTQGRIIFWWRPVLIPSEPDLPYPKEPRSGLYEAVPGTTPADWTVQPLLENIGLFPQTFLSPDQTKLAVLVRDDSSSIADFSRIHIYSFKDGLLMPLNNEDYLHELSWLPDNQAVIYPQSSNIALARLDGSPPELLTDNLPDPIEGEPYSYFLELVGSPDGRLVALDAWLGTGVAERGFMPISRTVTLFDTQQKAVISVIENSAIGAIDMRWSPDSQWLAFTGDQNQGLYVLNVQTLTTQQLIEPPSLAFAAWSSDGRHLAFASDGKLSIWDAESQTTQVVTSKDYVSEPSWSPDGSLIAAIYQEEGESGIVIVNPSSQSEEMLNNSVRSGQVIWSPDGEWLAGEQNGFGLYIVNKNTGDIHLVFDTAGFPSPTSIMWLP